MAGGSKKVIFAALIGNALIAVTKFIAGAITGSSAMFSEAIHSLVDTGNQGLLLYGLKRSKKPADARHPFGYGGEMYFWAFVVAVLIFAVGAGVSIYEGIHKLQEPEPLEKVWINYVVLGLAICFEAVAWWIAFKEFNRQRGDEGYFSAVTASKDPAIFTVLFEDTAAMLGLLVALVGISLAQALDAPWIDGASSIVIGCILAATAAFLAYECKGLLIGEGASEKTKQQIRNILAGISGKAQVNEVLTFHFGPEHMLVAVSLDFESELSADDVEQITTQLEKAIKQRIPQTGRVFIEAQGRSEHSLSLEEVT